MDSSIYPSNSLALSLGSTYWSSCFCLVAQSRPTLCNPVDCSTPGFPVLPHLLELTQTYVHWVSDVILPSHPLSPPSPPAFNLSQHQGLFQWVSSLRQVAKVLDLQPQHQSLQWIFRIDFLWDWLVWSPCSPGDSQESSLIPQFKSINSGPITSRQIGGEKMETVTDYFLGLQNQMVTTDMKLKDTCSLEEKLWQT